MTLRSKITNSMGFDYAEERHAKIWLSSSVTKDCINCSILYEIIQFSKLLDEKIIEVTGLAIIIKQLVNGH